VWWIESGETNEVVGGPFKSYEDAVQWGRKSPIKGAMYVVERWEGGPWEPIATVLKKDLTESDLRGLMSLQESAELVLVSRPNGWLQIFAVNY